MKYELLEGRHILRDGKPFVQITPSGRAYPAEVEMFARAIVVAMNERDVFFSPQAEFVIETPLTGFLAGLRGAAIGARRDYRAFRVAALEMIAGLPELDALALEPFARLIISPSTPTVEAIMAEMDSIDLA